MKRPPDHGLVGCEMEFAVQPGERESEIGYGTGPSIVALAASVRETDRVTGVDISSRMQKVAQKRVNSSNCADRVTLLVGETDKDRVCDGELSGEYVKHTCGAAAKLSRGMNGGGRGRMFRPT